MGRVTLALVGLFSTLLAAPAWARMPVVVELYTAQGCASCVKAGQVLSDLGDKPPVLTLTFGVDYWDYLGWRDTFAKPEFSARQRSYMAPLDLRDVYTPQVVIDGLYETAAASTDKIEPLIKQAAHARAASPQIQFHKTEVAVGSGARPKGGGEVWLVRYDPRDQTVTVKNGDNRGQTLIEHHVVCELIRLGSWNGRPRRFALPDPTAEGLKTVVLVQTRAGGRILGVGEL